MILDFIANPALINRYEVQDAETGEEIENPAYADTETGELRVFKLRPMNLGDKPGCDLRIKAPDGSYALAEWGGEFEIIDLEEDVMKTEFLRFLDSPEGRAIIETIVREIVNPEEIIDEPGR